MNKKKYSSWNAKKIEALIWLRETFPLVFNKTIRPLKIGITKDILDANLDGTPDEKGISAAIGYYVNNIPYLKLVTVNAERIDLQGVVCGTVSIEDAVYAREKKTKLIKYYKEKGEKQKRLEEASAQALEQQATLAKDKAEKTKTKASKDPKIAKEPQPPKTAKIPNSIIENNTPTPEAITTKIIKTHIPTSIISTKSVLSLKRKTEIS